MIKYEFPLNERIRKFLRIEEIFKKMDSQMTIKGDFVDHSCFNTFFELMATASRADLKVELIQEIEKQRSKMKTKSKTKKNIVIIKDLDITRKKLEKSKIITGFNFGGDKFLTELKTRASSPFGIVSTDFPEFQYWLQKTTVKERRIYFHSQIKDFTAIKSAISNLMRLLRGNIHTKSMSTKSGSLQYKLDPLLKNDLVAISVGESLRFYPNISSNKYAVNVHFSLKGESSYPSIAKSVKFKLGIASF
jgi:cell division protein ZapD